MSSATSTPQPRTAVQRMRVLAANQVCPSFVRVTLTRADASPFIGQGFDEWIRLFVRRADQTNLSLPEGPCEGWYTRWQKMDEAIRPVVRNYTVRDVRYVNGAVELDIDFVIHRNPVTGGVEGLAAAWALQTWPGDEVGVLSQGLIFDASRASGSHVLLLADETGLPGVESIARSLTSAASVRAVLEVPTIHDQRPLMNAASGQPIEVTWLTRDDLHARPGSVIKTELPNITWPVGGYAYATGEMSMTRAVQKAAESAGMEQDQARTCAYWRPSKKHKAASTAN